MYINVLERLHTSHAYFTNYSKSVYIIHITTQTCTDTAHAKQPAMWPMGAAQGKAAQPWS